MSSPVALLPFRRKKKDTGKSLFIALIVLSLCYLIAADGRDIDFRGDAARGSRRAAMIRAKNLIDGKGHSELQFSRAMAVVKNLTEIVSPVSNGYQPKVDRVTLSHMKDFLRFRNDRNSKRRQSTNSQRASTEKSGFKKNKLLFIAINSSPTKASLRSLLRDTWIQTISNKDYGYSEIVDYRFFISPPPVTADQQAKSFGFGQINLTEINENIEKEMDEHQDIVLMSERLPLWGNHHAFPFGELDKSKMDWAQTDLNLSATYEFYLQVDDDGILCLPPLVKELMNAPPNHYILRGNFHCDNFQANQSVVFASGHADDNFLLMSTDLVDDLLSYAFVERYNKQITLSQNLRYWGPVSGASIQDDHRLIHPMIERAWMGATARDFSKLCKYNIWYHCSHFHRNSCEKNIKIAWSGLLRLKNLNSLSLEDSSRIPKLDINFGPPCFDRPPVTHAVQESVPVIWRATDIDTPTGYEWIVEREFKYSYRPSLELRHHKSISD